MNKLKVLTFTAMGMSVLTSCQEKTPQFGVDPIDKVIAAMTLEEKVDFVVGSNRKTETPPDSPPSVHRYPMHCEGADAVATYQTQGRVPGAAGEHVINSRLGIPPFVYADGPAGLRIDPTRKDDDGEYYCTAFPIESALSATWDIDLVEHVTEAMGEETREYGADVLLAPAINIHRNPLCGRNFEYFSEDPYLVGKMAVAYINGIQGQGVGTSLKHYAVNDQETHRNGVDARVDMRTLREIYLKGFEMAVREAQPWTIMSSYNKVNGTYASENTWLLTDLLRNEWGFKGFVMTDWWAQENGARQQAAGNDLLMPGTQRQYNEILQAVREGKLDEALLDRNIRNIMNVMLKAPIAHKYNYSNQPDLQAHAALTRQAACEGMVLLVNKNKTLPMGDGQTQGELATLAELPAVRVAAFGNATYDILVGGSGSGNVNRKYKINLDEGLRNAGFEVNESLATAYKEYVSAELAKLPTENFWTVPVIAELPLKPEQVQQAVKESDIAIVTLCRMAGEGGDRKNVRGDYQLSLTEQQNLRLIRQVTKAANKRMVVLLNMGNIIDLSEVLACDPDALLHVWMGGQESGNSIADVLRGRVCPSGKLPMTWAKRYEDNPSASNFPFSDPDGEYVCYEEGVMVGYRGFEANNVQPLFPFGFGLSYTTFEYNDLVVDKTEDNHLVAHLTIGNTGTVAGREVVQIYVSAPGKDMVKPVKELKGFCKTPLLGPGETTVVDIEFDIDNLASWNNDSNAWQLEQGVYTIHAAASSADVRQSTTIEL